MTDLAPEVLRSRFDELRLAFAQRTAAGALRRPVRPVAAPDVVLFARELFPDLYAPLGAVARQLRKLLPQPTRSFEDFLRYTHADLATLTVRQINRERMRITVAIGQTLDDQSIPPWFDARLEQLMSTSMKGRKR